MFERPKDTQARGSRQLWIIVIVVVVVLAGGAVLYVILQRGAEWVAPASLTAGAPDIANADPLRDLKIARASLGKDVTGTRAVWSIRIQNDSLYTYTNIRYEARYIDAGDRLLAVNEGTIEASIGPRQEKVISELWDILYPEGTARFEFRLLDATPTVR